MPPLRLRPGDVADLQKYFVAQFCRQHGMPKLQLSPEAVKHIESYSYPDNINELSVMVERAVLQTGKSGTMTLSRDAFWFATQVGSKRAAGVGLVACSRTL